MSKEFDAATAAIADTSHSKACEHAVEMAKQGMTPAQVLASINMEEQFNNPTWEDAVYALAHVHKRLSQPRPKPPEPSAPQPASIINTEALRAKRMAGR